MKNTIRSREKGSIDSWMILAICFIIVSIGVSAFAFWSYTNYLSQKKDVDSKIEYAVAEAKKAQADADEISFAEREKKPNYTFFGPDDYGSVSFDYPKTWSTYENKDTLNPRGGDYEAYLNPGSVPPLSDSKQIFALKVVIKQEDYDTAITSYNGLVAEGKLNSTSIKTADGINSGTRFDGVFSDEYRGALVIFKIRDKTLTIRTYADTFLADFKVVVDTIKFNQ